MHVNLVPFIVLWVLLALSVAAMIVWRKMVASGEDDSLHVLQQGSVAQQVTMAQKLEVIDKWGKILTIVTVVFGAILAAAYIYQNFVTMSTVQGV
jgi:hypothetical protein